MQGIFLELAVITGGAAIMAILFKLIKLPTILAYIFTGILLSFILTTENTSGDTLQSLSKIGITLLLFMLGLEIQISELRSVGRTVFITGIGQIVFTLTAGFLLCKIMGFSSIASIYASIALAFSSTILIVKLLSDKHDLGSLYGKISVGFLLVQDFFAIMALVILTSFSSSQEGLSVLGLLAIFIKIFVLFGTIVYFSRSIFPRFIHKISDSQEILFIVTLAWALGFAAFVSSPLIGFSVEIGGFLAGLALANSLESFQIVSKVRSLRDFFILIFFVLLGMELEFHNIQESLLPSLILSSFVLIGKPLIVTTLLGLLGYTKRVSFLSGLTVAQISEFSLIIIFLGNNLGHVPDNVVSIITLVGIITFTLSTYGILQGNSLYSKLSSSLGVFERKKLQKEPQMSLKFKEHILLIGAHRMGAAFLEDMNTHKENILIIDFNPDIVQRLKKENYNILYGDISDPEIQEKAHLEEARVIISSIPDLDDNILLLNRTKTFKKKPVTIVVGKYSEQRKILKKAGADYVILPYHIIGKTLSKVVLTGSTELIEYRKSDLKKILNINFNN